MEKLVCMTNYEYDILKLDEGESSDDSSLVLQVPAQVQNPVQVQENANVPVQVEIPFQEQENANVPVHVEIPAQVQNPVQVQENAHVPVQVEIPVQDQENVNGAAKEAIGSFTFEDPEALIIRKFHGGETSRNNNEEESMLAFFSWLEVDEPMAVWFKREGKWYAGIKCARADWPLSNVKDKPINDNENIHYLIFSPETRKFSWVDILHLQPIDEFPQPIACETHREGLKKVQDLTIAQQFMIQRLAVDMFHIVDLIHYNVFIESAQNVTFWKMFALESLYCRTYSDLGRMVMMLQKNIVQQYIKTNWKQRSSESWDEGCMNANSAETIELLQVELYRSIMWDDVRNLYHAPEQPTLSSEWKTWKYEAVKWFSKFPFVR